MGAAEKEGNRSIAMNDVQEKLRILLDYWIEHNIEHEKEFRDWADKVVPLSTEVAQQLREAAARMAAASNELMKAKQALPKSKGRH
jgi:rubrerythrin